MTSNELTFHQFVDGISGLVAVLTPDGAVEFCNRQVLDYFGRTIEELKTWGSTDAVHPDDLPRVIAVWSASVESGQPYDVELRQRRADGVYRWFHVQGLPVRDAEGRILRWCVLRWRDNQTGHLETNDVRHVFVMTGAVPNTKWLDQCVALDEHGFVKTGPALSHDDLAAARWPLQRPPYLLETSRPGVFAVGDVRAGNVKRVASAVGEGSIAVAFVHQVLHQ